MRPFSHRFAMSAAASLLVGQWLSGVGSARADEPTPVAADLVDLALAIPETVATLKLTNSRLEFADQHRKKGYIPDDPVEQLRIESESAVQKLQLLRSIVEAELDAAVLRAEFLKERRRGGTGVTHVDIRAAELRRRVLQLLKEAASKPAEQGNTSSTRDIPSKTVSLQTKLAAAGEPRVEHQVVVYHEDGMFAGWPANHGMWMWGDEILVGFSIGRHQDLGEERHNIDRERPEYHVLARSLDGGLTWTMEYPNNKGMLINAGGMRHGTTDPQHTEPDPVPITEPIDFTHSNFCMTLRFDDIHGGESRLYYSYNRGHQWKGPFQLPSFGQSGVMARTDYIAGGPRDCHVFLTAAKSNRKEGRVFCGRTTDGGLHWEFLSYVGPEPNGFAIMPSTVRLSPQHLVMTTRRRAAASEMKRRWIDTWASHDNGHSWELLGDAVDDVGEGNPPSMIRLADGRLCVTYGVRRAPFEMQAKFSSNAGQLWSEPFVLKTGGGGRDLGYPRTLQRPDGMLVTVYYFHPNDDPYRRIIATIWDPGSA